MRLRPSSTKAIYEEKWVGDTLDYTGTGKSGYQSTFDAQQSAGRIYDNGVDVHLFGGLVLGEYILSILSSLALLRNTR